MTQQLYKVRLYDGFDYEWIDITEAISYDEAQKVWNERTSNGTKNCKFADIDYYAIFPSDTVMVYSVEGRQRQGLRD